MGTPAKFIHALIMITTISFLFGCSATLHAELTGEEQTTGLVPEDYFDFVSISDPQISPDNRTALFVQTKVNDDASGRINQIYKVDDKGVVSAFTQGESDGSPKWSHDGKQVAFIRSVEDSSQVFLMPANGGEARQLTELEDPLYGYEWFPDDSKLLLTLAVENQDDKAENTAESTAAENAPTKRAEPDIVVVKNALYLGNGSGYLSAKRSHLFIYDIQTGELTQLTSGNDWNAENAVVSADGNFVYYHANKTGLEYEGDSNNEIYRLDISTKQSVALTDHPNSQWAPNLSPDNTLLTYLHTEDDYEQSDLFLLDTEKPTRPVNLTKTFDRDANSGLWTHDNTRLFFTTNDHGANRLFKLDVQSASVTRVLEQNQTIRNLAVASNSEFLLFTMESSVALPELYRLNLADNQLTQLTHFNADVMATKTLSPAEDFWFTNDKGMRVQGFVHKPLNFDSDQNYPLILNIKGGPGGMWGHQWFHENQTYAAQGYAVAYVNYRGSSGYGIAHSKAVRLDYGGADYADNIQFLDKVIAQHSWIDTDRLYITGGSHGGFLTNWITTKTDRFIAAVTQRSVSSWISEAGTQEYTPSMMSKEFGGNLWTNFDYYWDRSPLQFANKVTTPTLIIHSDQDMVTPIGQGQEWFYALKANDVPVEMVIFKGETHSLSRTGTPTNLVERLDRILDWFARF